MKDGGHRTIRGVFNSGGPDIQVYGEEIREQPAIVTRFIDIVEHGLEYVELSREERVIENLSKSTTSSRTFRTSKEWTRTWSYGRDFERSASLRSKLGNRWVSVEGEISAKIIQKYSLGVGERREESDEVCVQVKPSSRVKLTLVWKQCYQVGVVRYALGGEILEVPYRVAKNVVMDQAATDI